MEIRIRSIDFDTEKFLRESPFLFTKLIALLLSTSFIEVSGAMLLRLKRILFLGNVILIRFDSNQE